MNDVVLVLGSFTIGLALAYLLVTARWRRRSAALDRAEVSPGVGDPEPGEADRGEATGDETQDPEAQRATLSARVDALEQEVRRYQRWADTEFRTMGQEFHAVWEQAKLRSRLHELGRQPSKTAESQLGLLGARLQEWIDKLGLGTSEIHHRLGLWQFMEEDHERALASFHSALQKGGGVEAYLAIGDTNWRLGRTQKARDAYQQLLKRDDMPDHVHSRYAEALIRRRQYQEGLAALERLLVKPGASAEVFALASLACGKLGEDERAVELCDQGLRTHRRSALLLANMIIPLTRMGELDRAQMTFDKALEIDPEMAQVHLAMGAARLHSGKQAEAVRLLSHALRLKPDYPEALVCLGVIHNQKKEFKQALEKLGRAVEVKSDYAEAYLHMKESYEGLRDFDNAIAMLNRATQLDPTLS